MFGRVRRIGSRASGAWLRRVGAGGGGCCWRSRRRADDGQAVRAAFDALRRRRDGPGRCGRRRPGHRRQPRPPGAPARPGTRRAARQVAALPPADRLMVLRLRHEFTAEELRPLTGADLIRIAVEEAWSSPKVLAALTVAASRRQATSPRSASSAPASPCRSASCSAASRAPGSSTWSSSPAARTPPWPRPWPSAPRAPRCRSRRSCAG